MKKLFVVLLSLCLALIMLACAAPSPAPTPTPAPAPPYFEGKVITVIIPWAAASGPDIWGRMLAEHLPKHIPGKPNVVVRNMPAGGGIPGANTAYYASPDGLTLLVSAVGQFMSEVMKTPGVEYKLEEMVPLYSEAGGAVIYAATGRGITKPEDLINAKQIGLTSGGPSPTGGAVTAFLWMKELLGYEFEKEVWGYSPADGRLACISGEIDLYSESVVAYNASVKPYVDKGEVIPLVQTGLIDSKGNVEREPAAPDVPTIFELYERIRGVPPPLGPVTEAAKIQIASRTFSKTLHLPSGGPEHIVNILQNACAEMAKDPDFRAMSDKISPGAKYYVLENLKGYAPALNVDPDTVKFMQDFLTTKYGVSFD